MIPGAGIVSTFTPAGGTRRRRKPGTGLERGRRPEAMIRLRPGRWAGGRRRILPALALSLACAPLVAAASPTVDDVVAALRTDDDARAWTLLDELRTLGLGDVYEVRFLQGVLHLRAGEGADAARVFGELEASEGPAPALASGQALSAWAAGRPAEARTRLEHATRLWPEDPGVWANLGDVYRALAAHAYQRVRVLRRNAEAGTPSPAAPVLSAQPGMLLSSAPPPVLASAPAEPAGDAPSTTAAEAAAAAEAATPAEPVATAEAPAPDEPGAPVQSTAPAEAAAAADPADATEARAGSTAPVEAAAAADPGTTEARAGSTAPAEAAAAADSADTTEARAGSTAPAEAAAAADPAGATEVRAGSIAPAEAAAAADPAGATEARAGSTAPAGPEPSSDPAASSLPPPSPEAPPQPPPAAASVPLPSPENTSSDPALPSPEESGGSAACFLAGPWPDTPPDEATEWIQGRNARVLFYLNRSSHHRVYLGPFEDRKRAVQTMVSLKRDLGIGDVAWIPSGPLRDAVSLGVYLKRESVDRRLRALQALGLDPKVQPPRAGNWLLGSTSDLEALLTEWPRAYPDVPLAPERCPPSR